MKTFIIVSLLFCSTSICFSQSNIPWLMPQQNWEQRRKDAEKNLQYQRELTQQSSDNLDKLIAANKQCVNDTKISYANLAEFSPLQDGQHYAQLIVTSLNGERCLRVIVDTINEKIVKVSTGSESAILSGIPVANLRGRLKNKDQSGNMTIMDFYFLFEQ